MTSSRILIVDDRQPNVRLLVQILERRGYTDVVSTTDSSQAIDLFVAQRPDILMLDLSMPAPDGMAILRCLREDPSTYGDVPILVLTAETSREAKVEALSAGASDFVTMPFDPTEVALRVANLLETRRLQSRLREHNETLERAVEIRTKDLHDAYERERLAAEQLRAVDEMKDAFLMAVSHELRTPLTVLLGVSATLEPNLDRLPMVRVKELLTASASAARRLERLLSTLLDVDRIRHGLMEPVRRRTQLHPLVLRVLEDVDLKGHNLQVEVDDEIVEVDPAQVERIVEHLLVNAVRHTPAGTSVKLRMTCRADAVDILVEDDGPGVPDDAKAVVFERFAQGEVPEHAPGLGLGLALVSGFARLHGGRAWVQDTRGGGSSFHVTLGVTRETEGPAWTTDDRE